MMCLIFAVTMGNLGGGVETLGLSFQHIIQLRLPPPLIGPWTGLLDPPWGHLGEGPFAGGQGWIEVEEGEKTSTSMWTTSTSTSTSMKPQCLPGTQKTQEDK